MAIAESHEGRIHISFRDQSGNNIFYSVMCGTKLAKLLKDYCKDKNLEYETVNFLHNGERLHRGGTVAQAGLKNGDEIDVMEDMDGGGPSKLCG